MSIITVTINKKGLREDAVNRFVRSFETNFEGAIVTVEKYEPPESRADRLAAIEARVKDAQSDVEDLREELQDWHDNLHENFQAKAEEIEQAIADLDEIISALENVSFDYVTFPGMY